MEEKEETVIRTGKCEGSCGHRNKQNAGRSRCDVNCFPCNNNQLPPIVLKWDVHLGYLFIFRHDGDVPATLADSYVVR